jgi:hypothetical protein
MHRPGGMPLSFLIWSLRDMAPCMRCFVQVPAGCSTTRSGRLHGCEGEHIVAQWWAKGKWMPERSAICNNITKKNEPRISDVSPKGHRGLHMTDHAFQVGQMVHYRTKIFSGAARGLYQIFKGLRGSDACRNCTLFITVTRIAILV